MCPLMFHAIMKVLSLSFTAVASVAALATDDLTLRAGLGDRDGDTSDIAQLACQFSLGASIILPKDPRFQTVYQRWQGYAEAKHTYAAVIEVAVEDDMAKTVRWANKHYLPFLAASKAHSFLKTLGEIQGVPISAPERMSS
jgi:hypothetical protein